MRVERDGGRDGEDLRAVDESIRVVADNGEYAHDELEVTLELGLISYKAENVVRLRLPDSILKGWVLTDESLPLAGGSRVTRKL